MADDTDRSAVARTRRAKAARSDSAGRIDGGAVAAGVLVGLAAFSVVGLVVALDLPRAVGQAVALFASLGLPLGSYVAGRLANAADPAGARHGVLSAAASLAVVAGGATLLAATPRDVAALRWIGDGPALAAVAALLVVVGGVAGRYGGDTHRT